MRVLIFSQFFTPEIGATQTRVHEFARGLAAREHEVEVICEIPNHPQGVVHSGYGARPVERRRLDGFNVSYVWVRTSRDKTTRTRLAFYASYAALAATVGMVPRKRPDVIFASSPPLPVAAAAAAVSARHRVPWVMDVRDLWPGAAVAMGELSEGRALKAAERLELLLYQRASAITVVTEPFRRSIGERITDPEKITLLPNGTTDFWLNGAQLEPDRASLMLPDDRFIWTFAGNIGKAQGLEPAIDAAAELDDRFVLLILGDGPARASLEARAARARARNVVFRDQVKPEVALRYLRASDALLVPLAPDPTLSAFVPSKLFDFCAVGRPVVVAAAGEPQRLVAASGAAVTVPPGDSSRLAAALRRLCREPPLRGDLSASGRAFARLHRRDTTIDALARLLRTSCE